MERHFHFSRVLFVCSLVIIAIGILLFAYPYAHPRSLTGKLHVSASAQLPSTIELACPSGSQPLPGGSVNDGGTTLARQWLCVDFFGNVTIQGLSSNPGVGGGTGGGGGGGGTGGGTGTVGGSCLSPLVSPGMFCAGPIPSPNGNNPTFEVAFANNGGISLQSPATISGNPLTASSTVALMAVALQSGAAANAPDGTWTLFDNAATFNDFAIYRKTLTSSATLNLSSTFTTGSNTSWMDFLIFLGGTFTSIPHTGTSGTFSCSVGDNCGQLTIGPVAANNILMIFGESNTNATFALANATVSDSLGDTWTKVANSTIPLNTPGPGGSSSVVFVDQFATAGSHIVTIDSHQSVAIMGTCCKAYEISGPTSYYTGAAGPASFRYPTLQDFINAGIVPGVQQFTAKTLGSTVAVTLNTLTTVDSQTITLPNAGGPWRLQVCYSYGYAAGTGVSGEMFVTDGTNSWATSSVSSSSGGGAYSTCGYSVATYVNGASVTITVKVQNTGNQTISTTAPITGTPSRMQIAAMSSL